MKIYRSKEFKQISKVYSEEYKPIDHIFHVEIAKLTVYKERKRF